MPAPKVYTIPALKRLPAYLHHLRALHASGEEYAASPALARALRLDSMTVRKDLELIGVAGLTGVGYPVEKLIDGIETFLGWKNCSEAFLAGTSEFGKALLGFRGFSAYGLRIIAAFDRNPPEGETIHGIPVFPFSEFRHLTERLKIRMAILCVDDADAQKAADRMVEAGILAIWNFTRQTLHLPPEIITQQVNLAGDLAVLSVRLAEKLHNTTALPEPEWKGEEIL